MRDRFFVEGVHAVGARVGFAADDARKLALVLRKRSGDRVQVVDSGGVAYAATLAVEGHDVHARLDELLAREPVETALAITIAQAVPKGQKMDLVVEKATELGAHAVVPVRSARVIGHDTGAAKVERWRRIAKSAAQQSGRTRIPPVADVHDWAALLATFADYDRVYIPWELERPRAAARRLRARAPRRKPRAGRHRPRRRLRRRRGRAGPGCRGDPDLARPPHPAHRDGRAGRARGRPLRPRRAVTPA